MEQVLLHCTPLLHRHNRAAIKECLMGFAEMAWDLWQDRLQEAGCSANLESQQQAADSRLEAQRQAAASRLEGLRDSLQQQLLSCSSLCSERLWALREQVVAWDGHFNQKEGDLLLLVCLVALLSFYVGVCLGATWERRRWDDRARRAERREEQRELCLRQAQRESQQGLRAHLQSRLVLLRYVEQHGEAGLTRLAERRGCEVTDLHAEIVEKFMRLDQPTPPGQGPEEEVDADPLPHAQWNQPLGMP